MKNFTRIPNAIITDKRLSAGARLLYAYIASKPPGWKFSPPIMANELGMGEGWIKNLLKELEQMSFLKRERHRGSDGRLGGSSYILTKVSFTNVGDTNVGRTNVGKTPPYNNTYINNTDLSNTEREEDDALSLFKENVREAVKKLHIPAGDARVTKFFLYWTEKNRKGRMRFEREKYFDPTGRLYKWINDER